MLNEYNASIVDEASKLQLENVRLRIPRLDDDLGDVLKDSDTFEHADLFDGKVVYLQRLESEQFFEFLPPAVGASKTKEPDCFHVLFREWDPESWEFGPLIEVRMDKQCYSNKMAGFLSSRLFP